MDILLGTDMLSKHLALPCEGHLEQVFRIVGYFKRRKKLQLLFDSGYPATNENLFNRYDWFNFYRGADDAIPPNMPEAMVHGVIATFFVGANHGGNLKG